jgi:hypothetical protein
MAIYAGILRSLPELKNPTIVVQVDRSDLDFQLYENLFETIPKEGDLNSHRYILIKTAEYLGPDAQQYSSQIRTLAASVDQAYKARGLGNIAAPLTKLGNLVYTIASSKVPRAQQSAGASYAQPSAAVSQVTNVLPKLNKNDFTSPDYEFWAVIFHNDQGEEIFRKDADPLEVQSVLSKEPITIKRSFLAYQTPKTWTVWGYTKSKGWDKEIKGII